MVLTPRKLPLNAAHCDNVALIHALGAQHAPGNPSVLVGVSILTMKTMVIGNGNKSN